MAHHVYVTIAVRSAAKYGYHPPIIQGTAGHDTADGVRVPMTTEMALTPMHLLTAGEADM